MNIDYHKKYLKYKNKYLLTKAQYGGNKFTPDQYKIILKLLKLFTDGIPEILRENGEIVNNIICIYIRDNNPLIKQKLELLYSYFMGRGDKPKGLNIISSLQIPSIDDNSQNADSIRKQIEKEEKHGKNVFYYNLLCKIFDIEVTIDKFIELAQTPTIYYITTEHHRILNELEKIFSTGIPENVRIGNVVDNIINIFIKEYATFLTKNKIDLLYSWYMGVIKLPKGLIEIEEPDVKKKKEKFFRKLLYTIFNDLVDMDDFNSLAKETVTLP